MSAESIAKKYRPGPWVSLVHWLVHWFQGQTRESSIKGLWRVYRAVRRLYPDRDVICPTNYGFGLIINPAGDDYQITLFETGAYEPGTLALMAKLLHAGDTFLDVGANIGLMTLVAARAVGPSGGVFAFEPHPRIFERLLENIALSGVQNVTALRVALGAERSEREVYAYPDVNIGRASLVLSNGGVACGKTAVMTLDDVLEERGLRSVRMMKVDVEGFELQVLKGATRLLQSADCPILCVEVDEDMPREDTEGGMAAIHAFVMAQNDFKTFKFVGTKFIESKLSPVDDIGEIPKHDNVIYVPVDRVSTVPEDIFT